MPDGVLLLRTDQISVMSSMYGDNFRLCSTLLRSNLRDSWYSYEVWGCRLTNKEISVLVNLLVKLDKENNWPMPDHADLGLVFHKYDGVFTNDEIFLLYESIFPKHIDCSCKHIQNISVVPVPNILKIFGS